MGWRVLYIEESENISLYLDNIKVKRGTNEFLFPLSDLIMILIDNYKTTLSVSLINSCSARNIPIVSCGDNHHPLNILLPLNGHFESSKIFFQQIKWEEKIKHSLWQIIVKKKIQNQLFVVQTIFKTHNSIKMLEKYIQEVEENDSTNREGQAAKIYFHSLFGISFSRTEDNVINACLNYGYSIIRSLISKTIIAKGLNPKLGIFHKGPENDFNLSDDIIEIFRPIIDLFVYQHFKNDKIFIREHRIRLLSLLNGKLIIDGQKATINHGIEKTIDCVIKTFQTKQVDSFISFEPVLYDL